MSTTARDELVGALARRYAFGTRAEKTRILDEFQAVTGVEHAARDIRRGFRLDRLPQPTRAPRGDTIRPMQPRFTLLDRVETRRRG